MELAIVDAIGPFFRDFRKRRINWSKIPFEHLRDDDAQWATIREDLQVFLSRAKTLGFNAVTLDDVAHLCDDAWYEAEVSQQIGWLRRRFRTLFADIKAAGMKIFITSDYLTTTPAVNRRIGRWATMGRSGALARRWYARLVERFLDEIPEVDGVVLRIGESDGHDVRDVLRSRLMVRSATSANRLLREILPIFEERDRLLIFRTWTVGAHLIGDLIWHPVRLAQVVHGIESKAFVVSMKYGESDFFRYLSLNRHFFRVPQAKIIEFQARREYEGAGEYPSFIGWDCEQYARELTWATNVIGVSVWVQTGGWHGFRRLALIEREKSVWIEINAAAVVGTIFEGRTVEDVISRFFGPDRAAPVTELLRRSDETVKILLYVDEYARQRLYFRRVRIPPLLHVYWDCVFVNDATRKILAHFVRDPERAIRQGEAAFANFERMEALAEMVDLPVEDIRFMRDTFSILLLARRYYFLPYDPALAELIEETKRSYKARWPRRVRQRYRIKTSFTPARVQRGTIAWLARLLVRNEEGYRPMMDRIFTLRLLRWVYWLFRVRHRAAVPKFFRKSAMGVDAVFR